MMSDTLAQGLVWYSAFLFSTVCHEAAHAWAAWRLGDSTAYEGGQVSLDPWPHIRREPFGMVLVPLLSIASGGWAIGWASTPYNPHWANAYPKRSAAMGAAGPGANFLLMVIAGILIHVGIYFDYFHTPGSVSITRLVVANSDGIPAGLAVILSVLFVENLLLCAFNLLPVPPLDGSSALGLLLSEDQARSLQNSMRQPGVMIFGLIIAWQGFKYLFDPLFSLALKLLYPATHYQ